jgi:hypothetical protein
VAIIARLKGRVAAIQQRSTHLPIALRKKDAAAVRSKKNPVINRVNINTNQKIVKQKGRRITDGLSFSMF